VEGTALVRIYLWPSAGKLKDLPDIGCSLFPDRFIWSCGANRAVKMKSVIFSKLFAIGQRIDLPVVANNDVRFFKRRISLKLDEAEGL